MRASKRIAIAIVAAAGAAGMWLLYRFPPAGNRFYPQCAFHTLTGLDCPGCGTTRALHALLHGDVGAAFRFNPMLFALAAVMLCTLPSILRGESPRFLKTRWFGWTSVVFVTTFWIVRNTPLYPF